VAGQARRAFLGDDDAGLAQHIAQECDQYLAPCIEGRNRKVGAGGFQHQRRIGKAEVETLVAARHRGARGQHHAAAAVEQLDQLVEAFGVAGELLDGAGNREAAAGPVFTVLGQGEGGPVHVILLRNFGRERHTGQTKGKYTNHRSHCDGDLRRLKK
jgi:hypothetical protein